MRCSNVDEEMEAISWSKLWLIILTVRTFMVMVKVVVEGGMLSTSIILVEAQKKKK